MRVRHVERADVSAVLAIAGKRTAPFERGIFDDDTDYEALTESCFLSLILEKEDGTVIGAASFSDTPPVYATESAGWLKEETEVLGRVPEDFLYVHYLLLPEDETKIDEDLMEETKKREAIQGIIENLSQQYGHLGEVLGRVMKLTEL